MRNSKFRQVSCLKTLSSLRGSLTFGFDGRYQIPLLMTSPGTMQSLAHQGNPRIHLHDTVGFTLHFLLCSFSYYSWRHLIRLSVHLETCCATYVAKTSLSVLKLPTLRPVSGTSSL